MPNLTRILMRALPILGLLVLVGCGKNKDSDSGPTTGPTTGTWVTTDSTDTDTDTQGGSGSGGSGTVDTLTTYVGDAAIDLDALTWSGTESARVLTVGSGTLMCQFTWTSTGTDPDPAVAPCTDGDGNACVFSFQVDHTAGAQTDGDCAPYAFAADGGSNHYGYAADWLSGGVSYGEQFTYYAQTTATSGGWYPAESLGYGIFSWTPGTGTAQTGDLHYEIQRTLIQSYTSP